MLGISSSASSNPKPLKPLSYSTLKKIILSTIFACMKGVVYLEDDGRLH
jgi:hypothetical protein